MQNEFITTSSIQTKKLGSMLAQELRGGEIVCLSGELGAGKTTFTQGLLKGLKIKGPYISPTFNILKQYELKTKNHPPRLAETTARRREAGQLKTVYHIDAYRVTSKDLHELGWKDFAGNPDHVVIVEWAERVKKLIPTNALWISFNWISDKERKILLANK